MIRSLIPFFICILIFLPSCLQKKDIKSVKTFSVKNLEDFFKRSDLDIHKAAQVVIEKDLIKNLTHLQLMNHGGRRYYLLERENIAKVISSVTIEIYSDYILINKKGKIIYTYTNEDVFSKNVTGSMRGTILGRSYFRRDTPVLYQDVNTMPELDGRKCIFISKKVKGANTFPGIVILQLDIKEIMKHIPRGYEAIDKKGIIRLSENKKRIFKKHAQSDYLFKNIDPMATNGFFINSEGQKSPYVKFTHRDITWYIIR